jgi:hypothetical protein
MTATLVPHLMWSSAKSTRMGTLNAVQITEISAVMPAACEVVSAQDLPRSPVEFAAPAVIKHAIPDFAATQTQAKFAWALQ